MDTRTILDENNCTKANVDGVNCDYGQGNPYKDKITPRLKSWSTSTFDSRGSKLRFGIILMNYRRLVLFMLVIFIAFLVLRLCQTNLVNDFSFFLFFWRDFSNNSIFANTIPRLDSRSVYVPGGGFSGFWFILGHLFSISDPSDHVYYCYSSGCLGVLALLLDSTNSGSNVTLSEPLEKK